MYMSMVLMMMAGVVRKKKRKKRKVLIAIKRVHQLKRRMDRCFLGKGWARRGAHLGQEKLHRWRGGGREGESNIFFYMPVVGLVLCAGAAGMSP